MSAQHADTTDTADVVDAGQDHASGTVDTSSSPGPDAVVAASPHDGDDNPSAFGAVAAFELTEETVDGPPVTAGGLVFHGAGLEGDPFDEASFAPAQFEPVSPFVALTDAGITELVLHEPLGANVEAHVELAVFEDTLRAVVAADTGQETSDVRPQLGAVQQRTLTAFLDAQFADDSALLAAIRANPLPPAPGDVPIRTAPPGAPASPALDVAAPTVGEGPAVVEDRPTPVNPTGADVAYLSGIGLLPPVGVTPLDSPPPVSPAPRLLSAPAATPPDRPVPAVADPPRPAASVDAAGMPAPVPQARITVDAPTVPPAGSPAPPAGAATMPVAAPPPQPVPHPVPQPVAVTTAPLEPPLEPATVPGTVDMDPLPQWTERSVPDQMGDRVSRSIDAFPDLGPLTWPDRTPAHPDPRTPAHLRPEQTKVMDRAALRQRVWAEHRTGTPPAIPTRLPSPPSTAATTPRWGIGPLLHPVAPLTLTAVAATILLWMLTVSTGTTSSGWDAVLMTILCLTVPSILMTFTGLITQAGYLTVRLVTVVFTIAVIAASIHGATRAPADTRPIPPPLITSTTLSSTPQPSPDVTPVDGTVHATPPATSSPVTPAP